MAANLARAKPPAPLAVNAAAELSRLEQEFGGRQYLVQALTFAKQTKDIRYLLGLIADPENNSLSLAEICRIGRILPGELVAALASGTDLRSQLLAKQRIAARIPAVVGEVMQKAAEYEDDCNDCLGTGKITADPTDDEPNPGPTDCTTCNGGGRLKYPADGKCRDLALEMAGLTGGSGAGAVNVNVHQNVGVFAGGSYEGYERLQEAMDVVLYGAGSGVPDIDVAEGEVVRAAEGAEPETPGEPEAA